MIFEPALLPDFGRASRRHLRASLTCYAHFSSWTHYTWILGEELWEAIQQAKTISRGEIFESGVLDEGQELEILLGCLLSAWRSRCLPDRKMGSIIMAAQKSSSPSAVRAALAGTTFGFPFLSTLSSAGSNPPFPHNAHSGVGLQ
jgi:hypothetical protein